MYLIRSVNIAKFASEKTAQFSNNRKRRSVLNVVSWQLHSTNRNYSTSFVKNSTSFYRKRVNLAAFQMSCRPLSVSDCWTRDGKLNLSTAAYRSMDADRQSAVLTHVFSMLQDGACRGDNTGTDEPPTTPAELLQLTTKSTTDLYVLSDPVLGLVQGAVFVTPCPHARSCHPTLCTVRAVATEAFQRRAGTSFWREFARAARRLASTGSRYSACVTNVYITCVERLLAYREAGFHVVACVALAGQVRRAGATGNDVSYVSNYVMYAELEGADANSTRPPMQSIQTSTGDATKALLSSVRILSVPYLPIRHLRVLPAISPDLAVSPDLTVTPDLNGPEICVRVLRPDDIVAFYEAMRAAANEPATSSYGVDEIPDLEYFTRWYVDGNYVTVIELESTGQTVAYMSFCPSSFSRSSHPVISDANLVILPEFRHNKWAPYLLGINAVMSHDTGFLGTQGEAAVTNLASIMSMVRNGCVTNGCLPRAIYFNETGWTDIMMTYLDLSRVPSYTQLRHKIQSRI